MAETKMLKYRIPNDPIGNAYYRAGTRYEPGSVVRLPEGELAAGWTLVKGKPTPTARHAWKLIEDGKPEASDAAASELEGARKAREELKKQLEEQERLLAELEDAAGEQQAAAGAAEAEAPEEELEELEATDPTDEGQAEDPEKPKGKKKKRSKDQEV